MNKKMEIKDIIDVEEYHDKISAIANQEMPSVTDDKNKWTTYIRKAVAVVPGTGSVDEIHIVLCTVSQDSRTISGKKDILIVIARSKEPVESGSTVIYDEFPLKIDDNNTRKRTENYRAVCDDVNNTWHKCVTDIAKAIASITLMRIRVK